MIPKNELDLESYLAEKENTTHALNKALWELIKLQIDYEKRANKLWIETNFSEVIEESRPTVDMKKAYIDNQLEKTVSKIHAAEVNVEVLKNDLKVIDAKIKAEEKYFDVFCKLSEVDG